jgi:hypothetical protein
VEDFMRFQNQFAGSAALPSRTNVNNFGGTVEPVGTVTGAGVALGSGGKAVPNYSDSVKRLLEEKTILGRRFCATFVYTLRFTSNVWPSCSATTWGYVTQPALS